jgi:acetyl esterase/lipase
MKTIAALLLLVSPALAADPREFHDLSYVKNQRQSLDIFAPAEGKNHPIMVWIHGGGWQRGDKSGAKEKPRAFVERGYVFVAISYRFIPQVSIKEMTGDVAQAIRFAHDHAKEFGGDPDTIFVAGHSAGAQLAALVCTDDRYLKSEGVSLSVIKGCVPVDGDAFDVVAQIESVPEARRSGWTSKFGDKASQEEVSATKYVARGKGIPPCLVMHCSDLIERKTQSELFVKVLQEYGVPAKTYSADNTTHVRIDAELGTAGDKPSQAMFEFLDSLRKK